MRGKYKRKKQRQKTLTGPNVAAIPPSTNEEPPAEKERKPERKDDKNQAMKILKPIISFTQKRNYKLILESVGVLAAISVLVVYVLQLYVMRQTMRIDQRPWIKLSIRLDPVAKNKQLAGEATITNYGKTPAKTVYAQFAVRPVPNGINPVIDIQTPFSYSTTGVIFPNETVTFPVGTFESNGNTPHAITDEEFADYANRKIYFLAYGGVMYSDFFGVSHWTRYCTFVTPGEGTYTAKNCTDYSSVDNN